jgi:phosphoribosylformylglycinamidine synthase
LKARIIITPKPEVPDPQGLAVQQALEHMGYGNLATVRVGKCIEIGLAPGCDPETARQALEAASARLLANPVIEDFRLEWSD